ncbi:MAG: homocysteine S-methyltransferase family protein [Eubacterium sp.]|nr:homocysteine S-methyltransferase family protein [Eubacterium sp.]
MSFRDAINERVVILDGATGTSLQRAGMPAGVCPEQWVLEHPDVFVDLQKRYIEAGSDVLYTMTFSCNRIKLAEYGLETRQREMTIELVSLSHRAIEESGTGREIYVFGDLSMTGKQLRPVGDMEFEELVEIYKEEVRYMEEAGVDGYAIETMMSLQECRAALLAVKEVSDKPVIVTMTYESDGRSLFGTEPGTAVSVLQAMGADAVGLNCSTGPEKMEPIVERMCRFARVPIVVKPNAGMPTLIDGETRYDLEPDEFTEQMKPLISAGATIVGGCCGTDERYIQGLYDYVSKTHTSARAKVVSRVLTTERNLVEIDLDGPFIIVGERINPTGKKALQAELRDGSTDMVISFAEEQVACGAGVLDVNMGMSGIDEKAMMLRVIEEVSMAADVPLSIDSSDPDVIEAALRVYPGRALINSVSLEPGKAEKLLPLAKKYGAMVILLPLTEKGLPENIEEKHAAIDRLCELAHEAGLSDEDLVVDGLVATVGANPLAAREVLTTVSYCKKEKNLATICGLSNISFGLPERSAINSTFLTMAIAQGLTMAISNPGQVLLTNAALAADLLLAKEGSDTAYIEGVRPYETATSAGQGVTGGAGMGTVASGNSSGGATGTGTVNVGGVAGGVSREGLTGEEPELFIAILKGKKAKLVELIDERLDSGEQPGEIISEILIPAINHVGQLYEKKIYFLPQLISAAEAMKQAVDYLEPKMAEGQERKKLETIIMATVEGDVHDIGKNLVVLMLKNYGYDVIDLGKDVPSEVIIDAAEEHNASVIGLSALMTTTMTAMPEVVRLRNERGLETRVVVGGACVTEDYAREIGADGYSDDASEAVKLVNKLLNH